jgi:hypothetical protein
MCELYNGIVISYNGREKPPCYLWFGFRMILDYSWGRISILPLFVPALIL